MNRPFHATAEQIAAAQLRVVLDAKLDRETPLLVQRIAAMPTTEPAHLAPPAAAPVETAEASRRGEVAGSYKFEVYVDRAGKHRFRLKASNGEIIMVSEAYKSKASAHKGCEAVQRAAEGASIGDTDS